MAGRSDPNTQENTRIDARPRDKTGTATGRMTERQWLAQQALDAACIDPQAVEDVLNEANMERESQSGHEPDARVVTSQQPPGEPFETDLVAYKNAMFIAGGTDMLQLLQVDVVTPATVVNINRLPCAGIRMHGHGAQIGALLGVMTHDFH